MAFILNAWYVAAWPHEVTRDALLGRVICGQGVTLWRDQDGKVAALEDRCSHREMPLSLGCLENGTIRCAYHGLRFAADGSCVEIPGMEKAPSSVKVRSYPVVERHGWVWIWPGRPDAADPALVPAMHRPNEDPDWASVGGTIHAKCNYQLIVDNLLDLTHETYVHPTSLGAHAVVSNPIQTKIEDDRVTVTRLMGHEDPGPFWGDALRGATGYEGPCDRWQIVNFAAPSSLGLDVGTAPAGTGAFEGDRSKGVSAWNLNAITPETENTTWYFWALARNFQRDDKDLSEKLAVRAANIFEEDRIAMEAVQTVMDRGQSQPFINLRTDAGGVAARRINERRLAEELGA